MNAWDVVLIAAIALAVALAVRSMLRARKSGKCASCPFAGECDHRG